MEQTTGTGFSYQEMEGWPATPGTQRMTDASNALSSDENQQPGADHLTPDARMMYLVTAVHHFTIDDHLLDQANHQSSGEAFTALLDHAGEADTEHTFGCLAFASQQGSPEVMELQHIFALVRDPDWMGASSYLPAMQGKKVTVFESTLLEDRPGLLLARPAKLPAQQDPRERPFPSGEPQVLKSVLQWHGAISCHWIPSQEQGA